MSYLNIKIKEKEAALKTLNEWYEAQSKSIESDIYDLKLRLKEEEEKIKSLTQTEKQYDKTFKEIKEQIKQSNIYMNLTYYSNEIICYSSINDISCCDTECVLHGQEADISIEYLDIINLTSKSARYNTCNEESYKVILANDRKIEFTVCEEY